MKYLRKEKGQVGLILTAAVLLIVVFIAMSMAVITQAGDVKIEKCFGALTGKVFEEGLGWQKPWCNTAKINTQLITYETGSNPESSEADYPDYPVNAQTTDGQQIIIKYSVIFSISEDSAISMYREIGKQDEVIERIVKSHSRSLTRALAQEFEAEQLYSGDFFAYQQSVIDGIVTEDGVAIPGLKERYAKYGIYLDDFLVRKIEFDEDYVATIEQQQIAQEQITTADFNAQAAKYEKEQQITMSEADAQRAVLLAEAEAQQIRLLADAEAYSIEVRGAALKSNPEVLQLEFVSKLDGVSWGILSGNNLDDMIWQFPKIQ